ncbi:NfeD family protein [Hazenella sp. IB182357]|uniref:NfeD family protein n=1 Tax=Polycladospora coralii TaxID=2771432 RepID=A0A926RU01_9BACL|nr:NfeD family protein [Polycladospora coralii]MBS7531497.1 NfeD family protein [Polycladospora coralii]
METIFWYCLAGGILFAISTLLLGDLLSGIVEALFEWGIPFLHPYTIVGSITVFGGAGLILLRTTEQAHVVIILIAAGIAFFSHYLLYIFYVKPIQNSENSTAFRFSDLVGREGEVTISVPEAGYGEVMIFTSAGHTNQIAASHQHTPIPEGTLVKVVATREHTLYVVPHSPMERN